MIILRMHRTTMLDQSLRRHEADGATAALIGLDPLLTRLRIRLQHLAQHMLNIPFGLRWRWPTGSTRMATMLHETAMSTGLQRRLELQPTEGAIVSGQTMLVLLVPLQRHPGTLCGTTDGTTEATLILIRGTAHGRQSLMLAGIMATQLQIVEKSAGAAQGAAQRTTLGNADGHGTIEGEEHLLVRGMQQMLPHLLIAGALELAIATPELSTQTLRQLQVARGAPVGLQDRGINI